MIKENLDELDEMVLIVKEEYSNREVLEKNIYKRFFDERM